MRTTENSEICISIDNQKMAERAFKRNGKIGKESKVAERQRESVCVCVRVLIETDGSIDQHPQTAWDRETHLAINNSRHLLLISEDVWDFTKMRFLTVGLLFGSDI